jgi:hypothetical protein
MKENTVAAIDENIFICHSERSEESRVGTRGFFAALRMTGRCEG